MAIPDFREGFDFVPNLQPCFTRTEKGKFSGSGLWGKRSNSEKLYRVIGCYRGMIVERD